MTINIRKRLIGTYLLIILLTVASFEFALIWGIKNYYIGSVADNLKNQVELVSSFYNNFLDSGDIFSNSKEIIDIFSSRSFQLQITDKRARVIVDSLEATNDEVLDYEEIQMALAGQEGEYKGVDRISGERIISYTAPLKHDDIIVGCVRFTSSLEMTYKVINDLVKYILIFGIALIVVVFVVSFFIAQTIVSPVEEITKTADQMAKGNLTVRNKISNKDEIGLLAVCLNNMAEQLQNSEAMKNEFISSISHELRTPLTSIKGWAQTLKGTPMNETEQMQYGLDIIVDESDRLSDMVQDLLDFSRLQSARLKIHPEPTDINALILQTYEQMKQRALKQQVNMTIELPREAKKINADARRVKQILINIIDNALKFTPSGGEIFISGQEQEIDNKKYYVIKISDTGCGIPKEELSLIKNRFYKSKQNTTDKGTGLGLAICDELVKLHGGTMKITSEVNKGTIVYISLPL
ncbi:MAG TPA: HAMP domain-containing histidine kinase [Thermoanaerobacterales bacterium]|jgi:signal transduction histidine kinase|nr:HAMP domain-containing histidine kinase [Thermoanaerobacterales bacterium]